MVRIIYLYSPAFKFTELLICLFNVRGFQMGGYTAFYYSLRLDTILFSFILFNYLRILYF